MDLVVKIQIEERPDLTFARARHFRGLSMPEVLNASALPSLSYVNMYLLVARLGLQVYSLAFDLRTTASGSEARGTPHQKIC
jgi:choline dehydrogenase-like flavoprotein